MKKRIAILSFITCAFIFAGITSINAQSVVKQKTKRIINNTAAVIHKAHKETIVHKVYTGDLKKAISHQRFAIHLYNEGRYMRAMHHSRRARVLAYAHTQANIGAEPTKIEFGEDETPDGIIPPDSDIDNALESAPDFIEKTAEEDLIGGALKNIDIVE